MQKLFQTFSKYRVIILSLLVFILILIATIVLYKLRFGYKVTAKFVESGPLHVGMPVYFKGNELGITIKIHPTKDYKFTMVKMVLYPKNPQLPDNVVAKVKTWNQTQDYVDLVPLDELSTTVLKNGSTIDGEPAFDMEAFLSDIADSGLLVPLIQTFSDTLASMNKTSTEIGKFFSDSRSVLKENRQNLKQTTQRFTLTAKSLSNLTSNLNKSITKEKLSNTTSSVDKASTNILAASENIKNITKSVDCATRNLDKTMAKVDCTMSDAKVITSNVKTITSGFCEVLSKRFAGLRVIFGKPLRNNACLRPCSK